MVRNILGYTFQNKETLLVFVVNEGVLNVEIREKKETNYKMYMKKHYAIRVSGTNFI